MSVGTLAAVINSTYVALTPGGGAESEIPAGTTSLYVIVKAEAGAAVISTTGLYTVRVLLQDIASFVNLNNTVFKDNFNNPSPPAILTPAWTLGQAGQDVTFSFPVTLPTPAATGSIYQVQAFLSVGAGFTEVSHVESSLVVVS